MVFVSRHNSVADRHLRKLEGDFEITLSMGLPDRMCNLHTKKLAIDHLE